MLQENDKETVFDEQLYGYVLEEARDIILILKLDGSIVYANQAALKTYQYSRGELERMRIQQLRAPETADQIQAQFAIALQQGIMFRTMHIRKNQERFLAEVSSRKVTFKGRELVVSIIRDITHLNQVETTLKFTEEQYRLLSEDLTAAYEELLASEEELRQQLDELLQRDQEIQRKNLLLQSLHEITLSLMNHLNSEDLLQKVLLAAGQLTETSHAFVYQVDKAQQVFVQTHGIGVNGASVGRCFSLYEGTAGRVYKTGEVVVANDYQNFCLAAPPPAAILESFQRQGFLLSEISAMAMIPLKRGKEIVGIIGLTLYENRRIFSEDEINALMQFANMASIALENASLMKSYQAEIAEREKTEAVLKKNQADNRALLASIPDPLFVLDQQGRFLRYNESVDTSKLLLPPEQFIGKQLAEIFPEELSAQAMQYLTCSLQENTLQCFEYELTMQGEVQHYEARFIPSSETEVLTIVRDITERRRMENQLRYYSLHDSLTGVFNRACFEQQMEECRCGKYASVGLLICDVDGLKLVNDTLGHLAGDRVLREMAQVIRMAFAEGDIVARIGGDEFAVLLFNQSERGFEKICGAIREQLERYNENNNMLPVSLSLGYAVTTQNPPDMEGLFKEADTNMYREKLHQKQSTKNAIVQALIKALEARDYLTEGHGDRLQDLVEAFSKKVGLPERQMADLRLLAHFHDIGKVGIPDSILLKPGPLTEEEWVTMRQHTDIGYRIASSVPDLAPIANWILSHHEHWNGKGYPQGLMGENIPLACRILALADTYDAMTNDRPYRKAVEPEVAFAELRRFAGTQFDPELTQCFIDMLAEETHLR